MQAELFATREKNGVYVPADIYDAREKTSLFMTQRVEALEAEVEAVKEAAQQELAATRQAADAAAQRGATALAAVEQVRQTLNLDLPFVQRALSSVQHVATMLQLLQVLVGKPRPRFACPIAALVARAECRLAGSKQRVQVAASVLCLPGPLAATPGVHAALLRPLPAHCPHAPNNQSFLASLRSCAQDCASLPCFSPFPEPGALVQLASGWHVGHCPKPATEHGLGDQAASLRRHQVVQQQTDCTESLPGSLHLAASLQRFQLCLQERSRLEGALERARVGLEERNFLIVAHERSESSLAAHALDLTCRLNVALADHASLARRCCPVRKAVIFGARLKRGEACHGILPCSHHSQQRLSQACLDVETEVVGLVTGCRSSGSMSRHGQVHVHQSHTPHSTLRSTLCSPAARLPVIRAEASGCWACQASFVTAQHLSGLAVRGQICPVVPLLLSCWHWGGTG